MLLASSYCNSECGCGRQMCLGRGEMVMFFMVDLFGKFRSHFLETVARPEVPPEPATAFVHYSLLQVVVVFTFAVLCCRRLSSSPTQNIFSFSLSLAQPKTTNGPPPPSRRQAPPRSQPTTYSPSGTSNTSESEI